MVKKKRPDFPHRGFAIAMTVLFAVLAVVNLIDLLREYASWLPSLLSSYHNHEDLTATSFTLFSSLDLRFLRILFYAPLAGLSAVFLKDKRVRAHLLRAGVLGISGFSLLRSLLALIAVSLGQLKMDDWPTLLLSLVFSFVAFLMGVLPLFYKKKEKLFDLLWCGLDLASSLFVLITFLIQTIEAPVTPLIIVTQCLISLPNMALAVIFLLYVLVPNPEGSLEKEMELSGDSAAVG